MRERADLDGILVVDKPVGPTSHDVVALVRRLSGVRRVGHGGTLDPFAHGVLPVFIGRATRITEYHAADRKEYEATVVFGARSTTDDLEGEVTAGLAPPPDRAAVEAALERFRGPIAQRPPAYSAVTVAGQRAYRAARTGARIELAERSVTIERLELTGWDPAEPDRPAARLEVSCSAGTYVRSLARDLGERLGCGAYLGALARTASGPFRLSEAHDLDAVRRSVADGDLARLLLPLDHGLDEWPRLVLAPDDAKAVLQGQVVRPSGGLPSQAAGRVRLLDGAQRLLAIARVVSGRLHPEKVFVERA